MWTSQCSSPQIIFLLYYLSFFLPEGQHACRTYSNAYSNISTQLLVFAIPLFPFLPWYSLSNVLFFWWLTKCYIIDYSNFNTSLMISLSSCNIIPYYSNLTILVPLLTRSLVSQIIMYWIIVSDEGKYFHLSLSTMLTLCC